MTTLLDVPFVPVALIDRFPFLVFHHYAYVEHSRVPLALPLPFTHTTTTAATLHHTLTTPAPTAPTACAHTPLFYGELHRWITLRTPHTVPLFTHYTFHGYPDLRLPHLRTHHTLIAYTSLLLLLHTPRCPTRLDVSLRVPAAFTRYLYRSLRLRCAVLAPHRIAVTFYMPDLI